MPEETTATTTKETKAPEPQKPGVKELLYQSPGAPNAEKIEEWKTQHGEVYVAGFSETELFVWRPITRQEYVALQLEAKATEGGMPQTTFEEKVDQACLLWPAPSTINWLTIKAGTPNSLYEAIMQNSNFVPPGMASMLVVKL